MANSYTGEIRMFGGSVAPTGWQLCDGSLLSAVNYPDLFMLIGNTYGGDGQTNFAVPDFRGRAPMHRNPGSFDMGQMQGVETVLLDHRHHPQHTHALTVLTDGANQSSAQGGYLASNSAILMYEPGLPNQQIDPATILSAGGVPAPQAHENMQPFFAINFIICLSGNYPSKS